MPMLDEEEWNTIQPLIQKAMQVGNPENVGKTIAERFLPVCDQYFKLTGLKETNHNAVSHHRVSLYGRPCKKCGKPYRTDKGSFCAECGYEEKMS
jgi:hypothetical protein